MKASLKMFQITIASAWSTLQILDRQARKDCTKVTQATYSAYLLLTSQQAKQTYRTVWNALQVVIAVIWWVILVIGEYPDRHVAEVREVKLLAAAEEEVREETAIEHRVVPFNRPTPKCKPLAEMSRAELLEMAQQRGLPGFKKLSTDRLRRKLAA